jgi:heptosyltransferase-3
LIHIHPTSRWLFKCWRDEAMAKVIDALEESGQARAVLTSGRGEKELEKIESILKACRTRPVNLAGRVTLKQLAALSRRSRLFLGVDTAPMHIAAAVGTPVIALFGPSGEFNWGPWGDGHVVIKKDWECRPCGKDGCEGSKRSRCLEEISEEEVIKVVLELLNRDQLPRGKPRGIGPEVKKIKWDTDEHSAAEPQPKEITPSLPSPLEGEG